MHELLPVWKCRKGCLAPQKEHRHKRFRFFLIRLPRDKIPLSIPI